MINKESDIQNELADAIIETEEMRELEEEIDNKKQEIEDNDEWELSDEEFDDELDNIYGDTEIAGQTYSTSNALKNVDEVMYDLMKMEMSDELRSDKKEELEGELEDIESELEDLIAVENEEDTI